MKQNLDNKSWAERQWGQAPLRDRRRNKRAIKTAINMLDNPAASLPVQMGDWKNLKATYRLLQSEKSTHQALQSEHWRDVSNEAVKSTKTVLHIQDKSELDFSSKKETQGLGPIGNYHHSQGIILQSVLAVEYDNNPTAILGLSYQKAWIRPNVSHRKTETRSQRLKRTTEADYWLECLGNIERPDILNAQWVTVGDRENDIYKFIRYCMQSGWNFLIRANNNRVITTESGKRKKLAVWARSFPAQAHKKLELRARPGKPARIASLSIAWGTMSIETPKNGFRNSERQTIKVSCIRVWEEVPEGLEWFLVTNLPVECEEDALEKIGWYEARWLIEEYHKCLKTGCALEKRQLMTAHGLLAMLGFLGVIATRLLATKYLAKEKPTEKAINHYPILHLHLLASRFDMPIEEMTCLQYWHSIARLGGFIGRKSDGDPGWQTLWKGWLKLQDLVEGAELWKKCG